MKTKQKIVYLYFILLPFLDLATSLMTRFTDSLLSIGMLVKGITLVLITLYVALKSKSKYKKNSCIYYLIIVIFAGVYLFTKSDILNTKDLFNEITLAFKYLYFPIIFVGALNLFEDFEITNDMIKKILMINCLTYTALIIIPSMTGTNFNSYRYEGVGGTNGWFYAANETGAIMTLLLSSVYLLMIDKEKRKIFLTIPILLALSIMGTKVSYLGLIIMVILNCLLYILKNLKVKSKKDILIKPLLLITFLIGVLCFSPTINNLQGNINQHEQEQDEEKVELEYKSLDELIKNKALAKIIKISLSGREDFFLMNYHIYSHSSLTDKLFGISWSDRKELDYTFERKLIEIDYLDIFIHYGIIGFIIYFMPLICFVWKFITSHKKEVYETWFYFISLCLGFVISSMAGHVLSAPGVSIYLVLLMLLIQNNLSKEVS